jgi:hypothetical protein
VKYEVNYRWNASLDERDCIRGRMDCFLQFLSHLSVET